MIKSMLYLVKARVKPGREQALLRAIQGRGSVAGDEYQHNMSEAHRESGDTVQWVETCFCSTPLEEERPYWEEYFEC